MADQATSVSPRAQRAFDTLERYLHPPPLLVVISGPSGVGKDSVIRRMGELGYPFHRVVTCTDRAPRPGEVNGVDYWFVSTAEFKRMIAEDELLEYAVVYGQYKGVPKAHIRQGLASGVDVVMRVDVQGAASIRRAVPQALTIFLAPPSLDVLMRRLQRRGGDTPEQVKQRMETALAEMQRMEGFDYLVVNHEGRLDEAVQRTAAIMTAEKSRTGRREVAL